MAQNSKPFVIALEEHYLDRDLNERAGGRQGDRAAFQERLYDLGTARLHEMDEGGIDVQVISHAPPGAQMLNAETAIELTVQANDRLSKAASANPERLAGFAVLPLPDPQAAADELERCVTKLGFKGALVQPITNGLYLDDRSFWPIFARAEALDVPIYVHPGAPHKAVFDAYYKDYAADFPQIVSAGWGFTVETSTQAVRMVLSGLFDAYPRLKIVLGHMGESLPFSLVRIEEALSRPGNRHVPFQECFREHFYITTSGNFSTPALLCSMLELGVDRILFSVDWPFVENKPGMDWMATVPLSTEDKEKIFSGNARRLLKM